MVRRRRRVLETRLELLLLLLNIHGNDRSYRLVEIVEIVFVQALEEDGDLELRRAHHNEDDCDCSFDDEFVLR